MGSQSPPNAGVTDDRDRKVVVDERGGLLKEIYRLPSQEMVSRILEENSPRKVVQELAGEDFFWLVKKVGEHDCLPLLELASEDQWQYLLDLEIWRRELLDLEQTSIWLERLKEADCSRLVQWLLNKGLALAYLYFYKSIQVVSKDEKEDFDLPDDFFSIDGIFHIRVIRAKHRNMIKDILRVMAKETPNRYQSFLVGLMGVIPSEIEEEMYRVRSVRLAEHGFFPFEEAMSIYAALEPEKLSQEKLPELLTDLSDEEAGAMVPVSPLYHAGESNTLLRAVSRITDTLLVERLHLEFAGLCNQIISADGVPVAELDSLIKACRKAAGYLNLALESLSGEKLSSAEQFLKSNSLLAIFRIGYGLVLKLKWEAERWLKGSWFQRQGLDTGFWGDRWGGILAGLIDKRPRLYTGLQEGEEYRDFERISELAECLKVLRRLMVLDSLLEKLSDIYPISHRLLKSREVTFQPFLITLWARQLLQLKLGFTGIALAEVKRLFRQLREGSKKPPYDMFGWKETFITYFMGYASDAEPEAASALKETLSLIWEEFREEYRLVAISDLNTRSSLIFFK